MHTESVGSAAPSAAPAIPSATGIGSLGSDAFLKLLVAQLRFQNPMDPADGTEMLQQTAQFTTVETLQTLAETQERLAGFQQVTLALGVVGQEVYAVDAAGHPLTGVVSGLRFTADGPMLQIGEEEVPLANVLSIGIPPAPVAAPPADTPPAETPPPADTPPADPPPAEPPAPDPPPGDAA